MQTGRCYCGKVRYEVEGDIGASINCHCRYCRRAHSAAFATVAMVPSAAFRITAGEGHLRKYGSEKKGFRCFCELCGTRLFNRPGSRPGITMLLVTSLDVEPTRRPVMHINIESKAPWYEILDSMPQHEALPSAAESMLRGPR